MVAVGGAQDQTFAWDATGTLKGWGYDYDGEVGDTTTALRRLTPVSVSGLSGVVSMHGGSAHSVAAKSDGTVWAWGYNGSGQVGDGTITNRVTPLQIAGLDSVVSVYGSGSFSLAVSSDGRVWSWGDNYYSQLGDGTSTTRLTPVQISDAGFAWHVATPRFSPNGGAFAANVTVTVTCATVGATIHYTTNGADPTESDPTVASGTTLSITQTTTLKARAWLTGRPASSINSTTYTL